MESIINKKSLEIEETEKIRVKKKLYEKQLLPFATMLTSRKYVRDRVNVGVISETDLSCEKES